MYIDTIIRIKNNQKAKKEILKVPYSKMDEAILSILAKRGFIKSFEVKGRGYKKYFEINVLGKRNIKKVKFLSKPSISRYIGYKDLKPSRSGFGVLILSTNKGILTEAMAKKMGVGGKMLVEIW